MRRLSTMKAKNRKSETTSDGESEENGVTRTATSDNGEVDEQSDHDEPQSTTETISPPKKSVGKKRSSRGRSKAKDEHADDSPPETAPQDAEEKNVGVESQENTKTSASPNKRRKKQEKPSTSNTKQDNEDVEYEVDKIVGQRTIKGRSQFLVRWKGYDEDSDTWEQEKDLSCPKLIEEFLAEQEDEEAQETEKVQKSAKSPKDKKTRRSKSGNKKTDNDTSKDDDDEGGKEPKEFEVEKIIEVHFKKDKSREFLIRWKGFGPNDDTWEPEEHLNCSHLIEKFMQKVEKAKVSETRELRTNPIHTKRYTLTSRDKGRRLSRRHMDKQRATYHECDQ